jgi:DNA-binding transcriptional LysR family regulator
MNDDRAEALSDLRLLRTFLVLMAERSVSRTAVRLNLSQPAISHALARLRRVLDDPLLVKGAGTMNPTARGLELQAQVTDLLAQVDRLVQPPAPFDPANSRMRFAIVAPEFAACAIAPRLVQELTARAPGIEVEFTATDPSRAHDLLERGEVDFRLGWWPEPPPGLRHKLLFRERLVCLRRADASGKPLGIEEFLNARHVRIQRPGRSFSMLAIDQAASRAGRNLQVALWVQNAFAMAEIVAVSDLLGTLTERLAERLATRLPVATVPLPLDVPELRVALYWHERTQKQAAHRWFRQVISEITAPLRQEARALLEHE